MKAMHESQTPGHSSCHLSLWSRRDPRRNWWVVAPWVPPGRAGVAHRARWLAAPHLRPPYEYAWEPGKLGYCTTGSRDLTAQQLASQNAGQMWREQGTRNQELGTSICCFPTCCGQEDFWQMCHSASRVSWVDKSPGNKDNNCFFHYILQYFWWCDGPLYWHKGQSPGSRLCFFFSIFFG